MPRPTHLYSLIQGLSTSFVPDPHLSAKDSTENKHTEPALKRLVFL